jgi:putative phosphoribosyl transferase
MLFQDRYDAGRQLAQELKGYQNDPSVLVLGLPRGGVPVAYEVAYVLHAPLDVFIVRKLGVPGQEELAMGAIASGGIRVLNRGVLEEYKIDPHILESVILREQAELERREREYRGNHPFPVVAGRTVLLIDDGIATGMTMLAAIRAIRQQQPQRLVVAVPVTSPDTCRALQKHVDALVYLRTPRDFWGVGRWYVDFTPTSDGEVRDLLKQAHRDYGNGT